MVTDRTHYQVGDWVKYPGGISRIEISGDAFASVEADDNIFFDLDDEEFGIMPAELTKEFLQANGWKEIFEDKFVMQEAVPIISWDSRKKNLTIGLTVFPTAVENIHQLQHLMREVGIKEELIHPDAQKPSPVPQGKRKDKKKQKRKEKRNS